MHVYALVLALTFQAPLLSEHRGPVDEPLGYQDSSLFPQIVGVGDFDGNGLVHLWWHDVHWNVGDGRFERASPKAAQGGSAYTSRFFETFDLERDGDLDVLSGEHLRVWENQGTGRFRPIVIDTIQGQMTKLCFATHADFNGDGIQDFAFAYSSTALDPNEEDQEVSAIYLSQPGGGYARQLQNRALGGMVPVDRDGDGDMDLIGFDLSTHEWFVLINQGGSFFSRKGNQPVGLPTTGSYAPHFPDDYDGDGDLDLVISNVDSLLSTLHTSQLWLDDGTGTFVPAPALPSGIDVVIGTSDLDGDGSQDLLTRSFNGSLVGLGNDGNAGFSILFTIPGADAERAYYEDVDGDGDGDLITSGEFLQVYQQVTSMTFVKDGSSFSDLQRPTHSAVGDVDGDGDPDAFVGTQSIFINDGTGFFQGDPGRLTGVIGKGGLRGAPAFMDHDGDGDLDLFIGQKTSKIFENDGLGYLVRDLGASIPAAPYDSDQTRAGDLSGDGAVDVVFFADTSGQSDLHILENLGGGAFKLRDTPLPQTAIWGFDLGDVDADGDLDLLAEDELWLNAPWPTGGLAPFTLAVVPSGFTAELLVDMDGDGDLDAVTGGAVYFNSGGGTFGAASAPTTGRALGAGDLDGDGDPDLLTSSPTLGTTWEQNDGSGGLTFGGSTSPAAGGIRPLALSPLPPGCCYLGGHLLFDADLDGDTDLLRGMVYSNLSRAFYVHGISGPGHVLTMSLYGPPATPYYLAFATRTMESYFGFGRLFLDLSTRLLLTRTGVLDSTGRTVVTVPIPNALSLAGRRFVGQALVGSPWRATNADWFTLSDHD